MTNDDIQTIVEFIASIGADDLEGIRTVSAAVERHPAMIQYRADQQSYQQDLAGLRGAFDQQRAGAGLNEAGFKVGDAVEFGELVAPRYLVGRKGMVVTKVNRKSVKVTVPDEEGFGRFRGKSNVGCPNSIIRLSSKEV